MKKNLIRILLRIYNFKQKSWKMMLQYWTPAYTMAVKSKFIFICFHLRLHVSKLYLIVRFVT